MPLLPEVLNITGISESIFSRIAGLSAVGECHSQAGSGSAECWMGMCWCWAMIMLLIGDSQSPVIESLPKVKCCPKGTVIIRREFFCLARCPSSIDDSAPIYTTGITMEIAIYLVSLRSQCIVSSMQVACPIWIAPLNRQAYCRTTEQTSLDKWLRSSDAVQPDDFCLWISHFNVQCFPRLSFRALLRTAQSILYCIIYPGFEEVRRTDTESLRRVKCMICMIMYPHPHGCKNSHVSYLSF